MKKSLALLVAVVAASIYALPGQAAQADVPLVVNGDVSLTTTDFEAFMVSVPAKMRDEFRMSAERVNQTVDALWVKRMLSQKARGAGLDRDPIIAARMRQAEESMLADAYLASLEKTLRYPSMEARAREIYLANPDSYKVGETVYVQHILITTQGRTREMAAELAKQVYAEVLTGKEDFLSYAQRYSEDEHKKTNKGELGWMGPQSFAPQTAAAIAKMKPGDPPALVELPNGFQHIVRITDRRPASVRKFEEVREGIIAAEKQRFFEEAKANAVTEARADPKTHLHLENVQALKKEFKAPDAEALSKMDPRQR
jgi:parvulin-like peptidyl-prolyl isomerase